MRDSENSFFGLVRGLKTETKTLIREEVQLAKTEISEKIATYGRNGAVIAIGGVIAFAGLIVFLGGLGFLIAFAFEKLGLSTTLADFVGLAIIGLLVIAIGAVFALKGMKTLAKETPAPQKTMGAIQHLRGKEYPAQPQPAPKEKEKKPTSEEVEGAVLATENRIAETLEELGYRMSYGHIKYKATEGLRTHPYRWATIAMGAGMAASIVVRRKLRLARGWAA